MAVLATFAGWHPTPVRVAAVVLPAFGGVARVGLWDGRWRLSVQAPIQPMGVRGGD